MCPYSCLHSLARVRLGEAADGVACHVYTVQRRCGRSGMRDERCYCITYAGVCKLYSGSCPGGTRVLF